METHAKLPVQRLISNRAAQWRRLLFALDPSTDLGALLATSVHGRVDSTHLIHAVEARIATAAILAWQRVARTVEVCREGTALQQAARQAGFPSMGHCTRAFRLLFGLSPTMLLGACHDGRSAAAAP